nr:hypothetical protein [uncultured Anaerostipes sp.]
MMYKVTEYFVDLQDKDHPYHVGDVFPMDGMKVTEERLEELAGTENKRGIPLIELAEESKAESTSGTKKSTTKSKTRKTAAKSATK